MFTLARSGLRGLASGEALPAPYPWMADQRILLRRGTTAILAGRPGSMKTMFTLSMVDLMKVPTLYISNDSDETTIRNRLLARLTQRPVHEVEGWWQEYAEVCGEHLLAYDHVKWSFHGSPSLEDVELEMEAFAEVHGEYPHLVVVDVLMKIDYAGEDQHGTEADKMRWFDAQARRTGSCILVVHHSTEVPRVDPAHPCPPMADILQKINQFPALILTVAHQDDRLYVACVKNRHGKGDSTGETHHMLVARPEVCTFAEPTSPSAVSWKFWEDDDDKARSAA